MTTKYNKVFKVKEKTIWQTLILHNCLPLSKHVRFTSKNVAQYLLGSRNDLELFKLNEIKHLLLKFTPLIETMFHSKLVLENKVGRFSKKISIPPTPPKDPSKLAAWKVKTKNFKLEKWYTQRYLKTTENKNPIKVLFASTTPEYSQIITDAAINCHMYVKKNRWLCGYITANAKIVKVTLLEKSDKNNLVSSIGSKSNNNRIIKYFLKTLKKNKEKLEARYIWHNLQNASNRPDLVIIPDIHNNAMILDETFTKNIPVIGLVNSDCSTQIAYPIFGNADSVQIVHFFCHFLAALIAKSFIQQEYKQTSHRIFPLTRSIFNLKKKLTRNKTNNLNNKFLYTNAPVSIKTSTKAIIRSNLPQLAAEKHTSNSIFFGKNYFEFKDKTDKQINSDLNKNMNPLLHKKVNSRIRSPLNSYAWKTGGIIARVLRLPTKIVVSKRINSKLLNAYRFINKQKIRSKLRQRRKLKLLFKNRRLLYKKFLKITCRQNSTALSLAKRLVKDSNDLIKIATPKIFNTKKRFPSYIYDLYHGRILKQIKKSAGHEIIVKRQAQTLYEIAAMRLNRRFPRSSKPILYDFYRQNIGLSEAQHKISKLLLGIRNKKTLLLKDKGVLTFRYLSGLVWKTLTKQNKHIFTKILENNPDFALNVPNYFSILRQSAGKNLTMIIAKERQNTKYLTYKFNSAFINRSNIINNNILWKQQYFKSLAEYTKKNKFNPVKRKWVMRRRRRKGIIKQIRSNNLYYTKYSDQLWNRYKVKNLSKIIKLSSRYRLRAFYKKRRKKKKFWHKFLRRRIFQGKLLDSVFPRLFTKRNILWRKKIFRNKFERKAYFQKRSRRYKKNKRYNKNKNYKKNKNYNKNKHLDKNKNYNKKEHLTKNNYYNKNVDLNKNANLNKHVYHIKSKHLNKNTNLNTTVHPNKSAHLNKNASLNKHVHSIKGEHLNKNANLNKHVDHIKNERENKNKHYNKNENENDNKKRKS